MEYARMSVKRCQDVWSVTEIKIVYCVEKVKDWLIILLEQMMFVKIAKLIV